MGLFFRNSACFSGSQVAETILGNFRPGGDGFLPDHLVNAVEKSAGQPR